MLVAEAAPAKVNLDLRVTGRRPDGYHEIDSLVVFARLADHLTFLPDRELSLTVEGSYAGLDAGEENLVIRAARLLSAYVGRRPQARIVLDKVIPLAAGLGGGSADAAATLRGLNRLWQLELTVADLKPLARALGADVPVCLCSRSCRMRGIGEWLEPVRGLPPLHLLLVNPGVPVSTAEVFRALGPIAPPSGAADSAVPGADLLAFLRQSANDLEATACRIAPVIREVLTTLAALPGCALARLSGSGATTFGIFADDASLTCAEAALRAERPAWWVVATGTTTP